MKLQHFKPLDKTGFRYFQGTRRRFGLVAALAQISPVFETGLLAWHSLDTQLAKLKPWFL